MSSNLIFLNNFDMLFWFINQADVLEYYIPEEPLICMSSKKRVIAEFVKFKGGYSFMLSTVIMAFVV